METIEQEGNRSVNVSDTYAGLTGRGEEYFDNGKAIVRFFDGTMCRIGEEPSPSVRDDEDGTTVRMGG